MALPVAISVILSLRVWTHTPASPKVLTPVSSLRTLAFPKKGLGRRLATISTATSVEPIISKLQSFTNVQTHKFARLTGSSYPHLFLCRAAETFTSAHITVGYLPRAADILTVQIRAIDGKGTFTPQN